MSFIKSIKKIVANIPGWRTRRKLLLIESDDWGSIATPDLKTYEFLVKSGLPLASSYFARFDSLESEDDLNSLYDVLLSVKDKNNNPACLTACSVVANPEFDKIRLSDFKEYFFENSYVTFSKSKHTENTPKLIQQGIASGVFYPQLHGREHLNPNEWLKQVRTDKNERLAFDYNTLPVLPKPMSSQRGLGYLSAFDFEDENELKDFKKVLQDAASIFKSQFGFSSCSFVAPTSVRSEKMNRYLKEIGIDFHQMGLVVTPKIEGYKEINHMWGYKNAEGQIHWRRNVLFEPSRDLSINWLGNTLKDIDLLFKIGKPAVISAHRVNFIGSIHEDNRRNTLIILKQLLLEVKKRHPEVEFISSEQLGKIMRND